MFVRGNGLNRVAGNPNDPNSAGIEFKLGTEGSPFQRSDQKEKLLEGTFKQLKFDLQEKSDARLEVFFNRFLEGP